MPIKDPRVDAYIAKSPDFAKPILKSIRAAVHKGAPGVTETIKWGVPAYVDDRGILCLTAAFKRHCGWVFWTGRKPPSVDAKALRRITTIEELPGSRQLVAAVKEAAASKTAGAKKAASPRPAARPVKVPAYFMSALKKNRRALTAFEAFAPSHKREYVEWVDSAKTDETRQRRLTRALEWMASGKSRNWKYQRR
jgi:uncharacterized protein YdeI (YjbR/CyaY-like superfamily)